MKTATAEPAIIEIANAPDPHDATRAALRETLRTLNLSAAAAAREMGTTETYISRFLKAQPDWAYHADVAEKAEQWMRLRAKGVGAASSPAADAGWLSAGQQQMLSAMTTATAAGMDCVITAPTGAGKSFAAQEFDRTHKASNLLCAGIGSRVDWEITRKLHEMCAPRGAAAKLPKVQAITEALRGRTAPIVIDCTERLSTSGLRVLIELRRASGASFPLLFLGHSEPDRSLLPIAIRYAQPAAMMAAPGAEDAKRDVDEQIGKLCKLAINAPKVPKELFYTVSDAMATSGLHGAAAVLKLVHWQMQQPGASLPDAATRAGAMLGATTTLVA